MICAQVDNIINEDPSSSERYKPFLDRFRLVGDSLPESAYCTMLQSQAICARLRGTNKLKYEKLKEVHKLLFNQDVGGRLHNALVDIAVTLRVYIKLTLDIDIFESMTEFSDNVDLVKDNYTICSIIKPFALQAPIQNVNYTGDLITGLTVVPQGIEQEKVMVSSTPNKIAQDSMCTNIMLCSSIIRSGAQKGEVCRRPLKGNAEFCSYHAPKSAKRGGKRKTRKTRKTKKRPGKRIQNKVKISRM